MPPPPNILVIIMDDLCPGDLSWYGNRHCRTPHIDRLAREGVVCERQCSGPLCSPARASLMTGRYHLRTRVIDTYLGRSTLDPDEIVLSEMLRATGYATGCFGKWHLGDTWPCRPEDRFDTCLVHRGGGIGQPGDHHGNWGRESYFDPWLFRDGTAIQEHGYCTDLFGAACCDFITHHADRPFFAYLATNAPHSPLQVGREWWQPHVDAGLPEPWARLYGMVEVIDRNVGAVLACLENHGLADDTLVLFCSDHGPCGSAQAPGHGQRPNLGLRGAKGSVYEGGIRVPAFWRWPAGLPQGERRLEPSHAIDVFTTCCAAAGIAPPADRPIDGIDLLPWLRGTAPLPERRLFMHWHRGDTPEPHRNAAVIDGPWKWVSAHECADDALYHTDDDPREQQDIAAHHGAPCARLRAAYDAWFADMAATRPDAFANHPIPIGPDIPEQMLTRQDWRVEGADGWSDQHVGHWDLDVRQGGRYRAILRFTALPAGACIRLQAGKQIHRLASRRDDCTMTIDLDLPAGPCRLRAEAVTTSARHAVFQISIAHDAIRHDPGISGRDAEHRNG